MRAISSMPAYTPSRASERNVQQCSNLKLRFANEFRRSRSLQMVITIAIPLLVVTYLTLGIIRCVFVMSGVQQHPVSVPSSTLRADQR
jgi:hypothetical protein